MNTRCASCGRSTLAPTDEWNMARTKVLWACPCGWKAWGEVPSGWVYGSENIKPEEE